MPGIDPKFLCHRLAVYRDARPIAQKKRKMGDEKRKAANAEVQKLLQAKFIREVTYTTWLANVVLVKKANGKWRMCTDYTNLNKACPKDTYPLPCINFGELRKHNMRLNPEKCTFGVKGGKFLGFMLSARGIEANRDKCQVVLDMRSPSNLKELQRLSGRLVALSRFLPRLADKINLMTKLLRKSSTFLWNEACEEAFVAMKTTLATPPILTRPEPSSPLSGILGCI
uniref:Retrovirus-related Pol polyprotein from transposon 412 family n=1 Tax=Cajanus cajan TaxID=3821 RepID=A0A151TNU6_CAJCA|nr:Retrovirus-related Pol polyprotein from transposon 412 family [Cajanus cajan]